MKRILAVVAVISCLHATASAGSFEDSMMMLDPEERAHQACNLKGLERVAADKKLPGADRMKTSIFSPAKFTGTHVTAKGGAVRAKHRWYAVSFDCTVTPDQMKATAFTYTLGAEIPKDQWQKLNLWE